MRRSTLIVETVVLIVGSIFTTVVQAQPGPADAGTAIAEYIPGTGRIFVSVNGVNNWFLDSELAGFTGSESAIPPLPAGGGIATDNDSNIGETRLSVFTYTDLDLGLVALANLSLGDLTISYNAGFGTELLGPFPVIGNDDVGPAGPDWDEDGDVDGNDFLIWQRDDASASGLADWEDAFGDTTPAVASLSAVPEPSSLLMVVLGGLALTATARRRG